MQLEAAVSAKEACVLLGVKPQTLYAYASRGLVRRVGDGKHRQYLLEDLERLKLRQRARSGHGRVAAAALSFGEPVLDTAVTGIDARGPRYRGRVATELAEQGYSFEAVAELLWTGELSSAPPRQRPLRARTPAAQARSLEELVQGLAGLFSAHLELPSPSGDLDFARSLMRSLAERLVPARARRPSAGIAEMLASACRSRADAARAIDAALIVLADHELNASSFAARIAASTGASLLACVCAALTTLSGPRHGGACDRVEALLGEASRLTRPTDVLTQRARRGDSVPGFGHPLYPLGDPRAVKLLQLAEEADARGAAGRMVDVALALARVMEKQNLPATVDFGLVTLTQAHDRLDEHRLAAAALPRDEQMRRTPFRVAHRALGGAHPRPTPLESPTRQGRQALLKYILRPPLANQVVVGDRGGARDGLPTGRSRVLKNQASGFDEGQQAAQLERSSGTFSRSGGERRGRGDGRAVSRDQPTIELTPSVAPSTLAAWLG